MRTQRFFFLKSDGNNNDELLWGIGAITVNKFAKVWFVPLLIRLGCLVSLSTYLWCLDLGI